MGTSQLRSRLPARGPGFATTFLPLAAVLLLALDLNDGQEGAPAWQVLLVVGLCLGAATGWRARELFNPVALYVVVFSAFHFAFLVLIDLHPRVRHQVGDLPG